MPDLTVSVSVPLLAAIGAAELMSFVYYALVHRHDLGDRYLVTGLVCDVIMAFLMQHIIKHHYHVYKWEDAAILAGFLAVLFSCLTAPHSVHNGRSANRFFVNILHKFGMMFAMGMAMLIFRDY